MAPCAFCYLAEATIFIAEVIFRVLFTEFILVFTSFSEAIIFLIKNEKLRMKNLLCSIVK